MTSYRRTKTCVVYAHKNDPERLLFVIEGISFPKTVERENWRLAAYGAELPDREKAWLRSGGFCIEGGDGC